MEMALWGVLVLLLASNCVFLWLWLTKPKRIERPDLADILQALADFQENRGCLVQIRRIDPEDLLIWGRGR
jgi:hypothetical protein